MAGRLEHSASAPSLHSSRDVEITTASGPPLDYSFKELRSAAEIETEEPRSGARRSSMESREGDSSRASPEPGLSGAIKPVSALAPKLRVVVRNVTTSVKLNNNMLESVSGLPQALETTMPSPIVNLQWLDLSFNQLVTIEPELLRFLNLKALYLHGNCLRSLPSVERLRKLPKLLSLTLNGNPIESSKIYRPYVIGALNGLRSLDHSTITQDESTNSAAWFKSHLMRVQKRKEDAQFSGGMDD
mmetsp:Transcript_62362/g.140554  ORF Transcript_62362/g.140554 Transcript_62362/m.140554 type:complete len:244 (-) Transcript_62362:72-803(-)|eukprot:CAMPEP_0197890536 /NCGR_PEP_ID=MMETSP1439-20131203/27073_1 /TAXON_ID=66791 /ORGANISM="Gonyaulax spinifera, Strain CCMP409" /LENGTH=243 /DNA_ID=CAMNT_0043510585 /DNA_START=66 /DNA_END=797 /DNA_ORIENTATION=+